MKPVPAMPARSRVVIVAITSSAAPADECRKSLLDITPVLQDYCTREAKVNPEREKVQTAGTGVAGDQVENLALVLDAVRTGRLRTRPELVRELGLGRNVVSQRVGQLLELGLLDEGLLAPSTGGRPSRQLRFRSEAGC